MDAFTCKIHLDYLLHTYLLFSLQFAVFRDDADCEIIKILLAACPVSASKYIRGNIYPLHFAAACQSISVFNLLLQYYHDAIHQPSEQGKLPLHWWCCTSDPNIDVFYSLVRHCPESLLHTDLRGDLPLHLILKSDADRSLITEAVTVMVRLYPEIARMKDSTGLVAIHLAYLAHADPLYQVMFMLLPLYPEALEVPLRSLSDTVMSLLLEEQSIALSSSGSSRPSHREVFLRKYLSYYIRNLSSDNQSNRSTVVNREELLRYLNWRARGEVLLCGHRYRTSYRYPSEIPSTLHTQKVERNNNISELGPEEPSQQSVELNVPCGGSVLVRIAFDQADLWRRVITFL